MSDNLPALPAPITPDNATPALPAAVTQLALDIERAILSGRGANTVRAYRADYQDFAAFMELPTGARALEVLVSLDRKLAVSSAIAYRQSLVDRGLSTATIARRLSALRAAVALAHRLGICPWKLEVDVPKVESYRDTRGPGVDGWASVLRIARARATTIKGRRDLAILLLLHDLALRRASVCAIDLADLDLSAGTVWLTSKGKSDKILRTLPARTRGALADWLTVRGTDPGPLFPALHCSERARLTPNGLYKLIRTLGYDAGLSRPLRPHGLRHQAITEALDKTGGDIRRVQQFSGHANPKTLMIYDDARRDDPREIAELISQD